MPYKGQKKRIDPAKEHGYIGDGKTKYKPPPKLPYDDNFERGYWILRDRVIFSDVFTCEETKEEILKRYKT
jgi:hypothetical protein